MSKSLLALLIVTSTVGSSFAQLSASFTNQTACDRTVTFYNNSTGFATVLWDFGDANTSLAVHPVHQYASSGIFTVTLTVGNGALTSVFSQSITVYDPPGQLINGVIDICKDETATYNAATSGSNYQWVVYGGAITGGQGTSTITVLWANIGTGYVELTEANLIGCSATTRMNVEVHPLPGPFFSTTVDSTGSLQDRLSACEGLTKFYALLPPLNPGSAYSWEITGGDIIGSSTLSNVTVRWNTAGTGKIKITETTAQGCIGSHEVVIEIIPAPQAAFTVADICLGSEAVFQDQSTGDVESWYWNFGDGASSSYQSPTHVYSSPGTYDVTLHVTSPQGILPNGAFSRGCSDTIIIPITVDQNPGQAIICPGTVCAGDVETYTTPAIAGATYQWNITGGTVTSGGGTSDNEITIQWGNGPVGVITLLVTGGGISCPYPSVTEIPIVSPNPQLYGPTVVCRFNAAIYDAPLLPGATYNWTVTGGTINTGQGTSSIRVFFNTTGTQTVTLDVDHDLANCSGQNSLTVEVLNPFNFFANPVACAQSTVNYSVSGTPNSSGYTWNWTVTGGAITSGQGTNTISVLWGSGTAGEITVDAPAGIYCNAQENRAITIKPLPPPAQLSGAMNVCATSNVTYFLPAGYYNTWTVTGGTILSGGTGNNYATIEWGASPTGQIIVVQEDRSTWPPCPTTTDFTVDISNNNPITLSGLATVCANSTATYTSSSNSNLPHLWEVTGGTIVSGLGTNSITVQWGNGIFGTVSVTEQICNNTDMLAVEIITPEPPIIDTIGAACDGNSIGLHVVNEIFASYQWNTGASTTSITVSAPGIYSVTVTDDFGCTASNSITLNAIPTLPVPDASIIGSGPGIAPIMVLRLTALPEEHLYQWSTGSTRQNIYVSTVGTYFVTVTNEFGCSDVASVDVTNDPGGGISGGGGSGPGGGTGGGICPLVDPDFTNTICNPIQFTNTTDPPVLAYFWDWGDAEYSWEENPVHDYASAGNYDVILYATDNGICWSMIQYSINVPSHINPGYNIVPSCYSDPIQLTDHTTTALPLTGWQWDFGDGNNSIQQNPSHLYSTHGDYQVSLTVTDGICSATFEQTVSVEELVADFSVREACLGMFTLFTNSSYSSHIMTTWNWDFDDGTTSTRKNPAHRFQAAGIYNVTLTVTDIAGCAASVTQPVNVLQFNAGDITPPGPLAFCEGESIDLTAPAGAGYTYLWSTGETTQVITTQKSGAYYVIVTEPGGCKETVGPVSVLVYPKPFAYILPNGPLSFCDYGSFTSLAANPSGAGFSYQWIKDGTNTATSQLLTVYTVSHSGNYEVIVTDNHACKDTSAALVVTIHPNPPSSNITASGTTTFCEGDNVTLTAPAGYSYQWTNGSVAQSVTIFTTGFHTVTITDPNGCSNANSQNVTVMPLPDMRLVPYGCYEICLADSVRIYGPPGMTSYQWSTGATTQSIVIDAEGNYNLTAVNSFGCDKSSANLNISATNPLGVHLGSDVSFCEGGSVTFDAGAGFDTYTWQDGSAGQTFIATVTGDYFVLVSDTNGCEGRDTVTLTVFPNPVVDLPDDAIVCDLINITLDAGAGFIYLWNDNTTDQTLAVTNPGTYSVMITDGNGCTASDNTTITLAATTVPLIASATAVSICEGESVQLTATGGITYNWSPPATLDNPGISNPVATPLATTTYIVTSDDLSGCMKSDSLTISVLPVFTASIDSAVNVCYGESVQLNVTGGTAFQWSPGTGLSCTDCRNPVASPVQTLSYSVTVSANGYCNSDTVLHVTVNVLPLPDPGLPPEVTIAYGSEFTFTPNGGLAEYNWTASDGWSCSNCPTPTVTPSASISYTLEAVDIHGCKAYALGSVEVLDECEGKFTIPTAFSPNGDGHNDVFRILHSGDLQLIDFKVFNRWGEIVFETKDPNKGWNGFYKGELQELSVFAYYAKMTCGHDIKTLIGNVTLVH